MAAQKNKSNRNINEIRMKAVNSSVKFIERNIQIIKLNLNSIYQDHLSLRDEASQVRNEYLNNNLSSDIHQWERQYRYCAEIVTNCELSIRDFENFQVRLDGMKEELENLTNLYDKPDTHTNSYHIQTKDKKGN